MNEVGNVTNDSDKGNVMLNNNTSNKRRLLVIVIIFLILVIGCGIVYFMLNRSRNVFEIVIDNVFDYLESNTLNNRTVSGDFSFRVSGSSNNIQENGVFSLINKIEFSGTYKIDYEDKIMDLEIDSNYDGDRLVNGNIYMEEGSGYVYLDNLYDKYIEVSIDEYDSLFSGYNKKEDYRIILEKLRYAIKDSLKDEYFIEEDTNFNGEEVDKITLVLNRDNLVVLSNDIIVNLENDETFLNSMANILDISVDEVKELLNSYKEIEDDYEDKNISLYINNREILGIEVSNIDNKIIIGVDNNSYNIDFYEEDIMVYEMDITVSDGSSYNVSLRNVEDGSLFSAFISSSVEYGVSVSKKDVSNSINYEDVPDSDIIDIYGNILSEEGIINFLRDLSSISVGTELDGNYSVDI